MFGKKTHEQKTEKVDTIIGNGTNIHGSINADGNLRIDGNVEGDVTIKGDVFVGKTGIVNANVKGNNVTVAGEIHGNIVVEDKLELHSTAKVYGDIEVDKLIINEGAVFKGLSKMVSDKESFDKVVDLNLNTNPKDSKKKLKNNR